MSTQQPFELKGSLFTLTVLHLHQNDLAAIEQHLAAKVQLAPGFFQNIPVIIDLSALGGFEMPDFDGLIRLLRKHGLVAVAARNGSETMREKALQAGLPALAKSKPADVSERVQTNNDRGESGEKNPPPQADETSSHAPLRTASVAAGSDAEIPLPSPASAAPLHQSRLHGQPVRSGQQVYAQGSDLIVIGAVSPGAEVLADGSIHIYGPLRGRALAGVQGDMRARIFCQSLEAELVSIAGNYRILEEVDDVNRGRQMQIYLEQERLVIEPLAR